MVGYVAGAAQVVGVVEVLLVLGRGGAVGVAVACLSVVGGEVLLIPLHGRAGRASGIGKLGLGGPAFGQVVAT